MSWILGRVVNDLVPSRQHNTGSGKAQVEGGLPESPDCHLGSWRHEWLRQVLRLSQPLLRFD